ncbi:MAG: aa3-type cytochrome c oxidase subunit IV [Beijerinckiaceae bacterium]
MADHHAPAGGHPDMDYAEHEKTYNMFIFLTKWTVIGNVVLLALMAYFLL